MRNVKNVFLLLVFILVLLNQALIGQNKVVKPSLIKYPVAFEITGKLSENPIVYTKGLDKEEFFLNARRDRVINKDILPPDFSKQEADTNEQKSRGLNSPRIIKIIPNKRPAHLQRNRSVKGRNIRR